MKNKKLNEMLGSLVPFIGLLLIVVFFAIMTGGRSITINNIRTVLEQSIIQIIATTGVFFVMSLGMMDLSIGGVICLCCYLFARLSQINVVLGLVCGLVGGVVVGLFNGFVTTKLKAPSFLATLCTSYIISGLMVQLIASQAVTVPFVLYVFDDFKYKFPLLIFILIVCFVLFRYTKFGHNVRMIGSQEMAATFTGIKVVKTKMLAYALCGLLAAIAAFLTAIRSGTAALSTGSNMMFNAMIALTLGGFPMGGGSKANFIAPIVGSLMLQVLSNGLVMLGMSSTVQQIIKGLLFIVIVIVTSEMPRIKSMFVPKNKATA